MSKSTRNRPLKYDPKQRVKQIFDAVWKYGSLKKAAENLISDYTGRPMSVNGIKDYLNKHGYRIVFGPYLADKNGNLVDPESLTKES